MIFYDFEVFKYDWLVVILDTASQTETVIVNDAGKLEDFYQEHVHDIWTGYNSTRYDQFILKGILAGFDPKRINDWIIQRGQSGYSFNSALQKYPLISYDVMERNDGSLKKFEGYMGNDIEETSVPFDIDRKLTEDELNQTIYYCRHDVEQTIEVFMERQSDFNAQLQLLILYKYPLNYLSKTKVQLSAEILEAQPKLFDDEFNISFPECAIIKKYTQVKDWYADWSNRRYKLTTKTGAQVSNKQELIMAGIPMTFGWGGCHGAVKNYHAKGYFLNMDVGSLYPSIMINFPEDCFSRAVPKEGYERFKEIKRVRLELKHQGKKKEQAPYKIVLNGTYGAMKDRFNKLYDPKAANNVCIYGMLLVGVDLLERLEETHCCKIIQVNTDGILIQLNRYEDYDLIDDVAYEWEKRTGLDLEFDDYGYGEIYQKDVNNYLVMDQWGHYKSKGEWIKSQNRLDYDLPIVNEALINYMTKKIPVEQTINQCNDLHKFQMVRKISNKYSEIRYGGTFNKSPVTKKTVYNNDGEVIHEKCVRIFASKKLEKGTFYKKSISKGTYEKLEDAPEHAFMDNGAVEGKRVPRELDKSWYIEMAKKRLAKFGI